MAEVFGVAASAIQVAEAGFKLHGALYQYVRNYADATKQALHLANEIRATSWALQHLGTLLEQDDELKLCKPEVIRETSDALDGCQTAFDEVRETLKDYISESGTSQVLGFDRWKWPFKKDKALLLLAQLERSKTTLLLVFKVLSYASKLASKDAHDSALLLNEKTELNKLMKAKNDAGEGERRLLSRLGTQRETTETTDTSTRAPSGMGLVLHESDGVQTAATLGASRPSDQDSHVSRRGAAPNPHATNLRGLGQASVPQHSFLSSTATTYGNVGSPKHLPADTERRINDQTPSERREALAKHLDQCALAVASLGFAIEQAKQDLEQRDTASVLRVSQRFVSLEEAIAQLRDAERIGPDRSHADSFRAMTLANREIDIRRSSSFLAAEPNIPPPPVTPKSSAFRDRLAAFNALEAQSIMLYQSSGDHAEPSNDKPFVASPPSGNTYTRHAQQDFINRPYMRDEDSGSRVTPGNDKADTEIPRSRPINVIPRHTVASPFAGTKYLQDSDINSDEEAVTARHGSTDTTNDPNSDINGGLGLLYSPNEREQAENLEALLPNARNSNPVLPSSAVQETLPFPSVSDSLGAADEISPPEININYAPPAPGLNDTDSVPSRNRMRAKSDTVRVHPPKPYSGRGRSPSLQPRGSTEMSAPLDAHPSSWTTSEVIAVRVREYSSSPVRYRSPNSATDQREYILDLADSERTPSNDVPIRKHPATFQCTLCSKRFTRAYNLRSHLRTHTDERPFTCTVCGKAFARQHDRKRHEGLHAGEKKFMCRGSLEDGLSWGCGRRFARVDALGRHFWSEIGRMCVLPLWAAELQAGQTGIPRSLPELLLQQYPALGGFNPDGASTGPPLEEENEMICGEELSATDSVPSRSEAASDLGIKEHASEEGPGYADLEKTHSGVNLDMVDDLVRQWTTAVDIV